VAFLLWGPPGVHVGRRRRLTIRATKLAQLLSVVAVHGFRPGFPSLPRDYCLDQTKGIVLPALYDPSALTADEKDRFLAALGDGYFEDAAAGAHLEGVDLPLNIEAGLLRHRAFYDRRTLTEFQIADKTEAFWSDDIAPEVSLFRRCPINFKFDRIRIYFQEQKMAFYDYAFFSVECENLMKKYNLSFDVDDEFISDDVLEIFLSELFELALTKPYSKPWYEFHIDQQLYWMDDCTNNSPDGRIDQVNFEGATIAAATVGRLIEQYYWKFLVEKLAIRGDKSSKGAKFGGLRRAFELKDVHAVWQAEACTIWLQHPAFPKTTVASIVKKRLKLAQTEKHISRVLTRP
jgi:hypothetical protein